ncbi:hypothetical protein BRD17_09180 [Halobacteriales archaeon SW_7_68_16]|nr:MAG: hypothetical protein BRD17_09180 [Halobacteriales archaeon SW_7_68_16]
MADSDRPVTDTARDTADGGSTATGREGIEEGPEATDRGERGEPDGAVADAGPAVEPPGDRDGVRGAIAPLLSRTRFGKFASVGAIGAVFDNATLVALTETGLFDPSIGVFVSAEVAIVVMFVLNDRYTFAEEGEDGVRSVARRFLTSNVVRAGGTLVGIAVFQLLLFVVTVPFWYLAANVTRIGVGFVVNYVTENLLTWRTHRG